MDNATKNKLTINKVAELCGVSKTTISRYLNGRYENMSEETRERIASVISELDYHPDRTAQRLKSQKSMLIGCVIADAGSPFSAILLKGVANCCEKAGYQVLFSDSCEDPAKERRAIEDFISSRVDGLLINTTGENNDLITELKGKLPLVLVDRLVEGGSFDYVVSPNRSICCDLTKQLLAMGYENITVISEKLRHISPRIDRFRGYSEALAECGIAPSLYELENNRDIEGCTEYLKSFTALNSGKRVAVICINGVAALNAILAAQSLGIEFGENFGIVTFDDWQWLKLCQPNISAVNLSTEEKGFMAARLLINRISGEEVPEGQQQTEIEPSIIFRDSTVSGT